MKGIWIAKVELMDSFDKVVYTEISKVYAHESYEAYNKVTELNGYPEYNYGNGRGLALPICFQSFFVRPANPGLFYL